MENQQLLIEKIIKYLQNELRHSTDEKDKEGRQEIIDGLTTENNGLCIPLASLNGAGHRIAHDKNASLKIRDDITHIRKYESMLRNWEGEEFASEDKIELERFISHLLDPYYKGYFKQEFKDYKPLTKLHYRDISQCVIEDSIIDDTLRGEAVTDLNTVPLILTKKALIHRLKSIIKPKMMVNIGGYIMGMEDANHCMSAYQKEENGPISYYDPSRKEYTCNSIEDLANILWSWYWDKEFHSWANKDDNKVTKVFSFTVKRFKEDPEYNYPSNKKLRLQPDEIEEGLTTGAIEQYEGALLNYYENELIDIVKNNKPSEIFTVQIIKYLRCSTKSFETANYLISNFNDQLDQFSQNYLNNIVNSNKIYEKMLEILNKNNLDISMLDEQSANELFNELPLLELNNCLLNSDTITQELLIKFFIKDNNNLSYLMLQHMNDIIQTSKEKDNSTITQCEIDFIENKSHLISFYNLVESYKADDNTSYKEKIFSLYDEAEIIDILKGDYTYSLIKMMLKDLDHMPLNILKLVLKDYYFYLDEDVLSQVKAQELELLHPHNNEARTSNIVEELVTTDHSNEVYIGGDINVTKHII